MGFEEGRDDVGVEGGVEKEEFVCGVGGVVGDKFGGSEVMEVV